MCKTQRLLENIFCELNIIQLSDETLVSWQLFWQLIVQRTKWTEGTIYQQIGANEPNSQRIQMDITLSGSSALHQLNWNAP